jgi:hypothetical protein
VVETVVVVGVVVVATVVVVAAVVVVATVVVASVVVAVVVVASVVVLLVFAHELPGQFGLPAEAAGVRTMAASAPNPSRTSRHVDTAILDKAAASFVVGGQPCHRTPSSIWHPSFGVGGLHVSADGRSPLAAIAPADAYETRGFKPTPPLPAASSVVGNDTQDRAFTHNLQVGVEDVPELRLRPPGRSDLRLHRLLARPMFKKPVVDHLELRYRQTDHEALRTMCSRMSPAPNPDLWPGGD